VQLPAPHAGSLGRASEVGGPLSGEFFSQRVAHVTPGRRFQAFIPQAPVRVVQTTKRTLAAWLLDDLDDPLHP